MIVTSKTLIISKTITDSVALETDKEKE